MKIKKYEAANMKEALKLIKEDLGSDAVILSTKKVMKENNFGLFAKPVLEVTAASDYKAPADKKASVRPKADTGYGNYAEAASMEPRPARRSQEPSSGPIELRYGEENLTEDIYSQAVRSAAYSAEPAYAPQKRRKTDYHRPAAEPLPDKSGEKLAELINSCGLNKFADLLKDIGDIKKQISDMKTGMADNMVIDLPPRLKEYHNVFIKNGVDNLISYRFLKRVEKRMPREASSLQIKNMIVEMLADIITIAPDYAALLENKMLAFVGPTGVGKTTTVAKIAASMSLKYKRKVCLITVDNFRIGAVEQLKTYAEIVNIPLYVAASVQEFKRIISEVEGSYDCVLIDSMGRSQFDSTQIKNIGSLLKSEEGISVALVLSMASNHKELADTLERYSALSLDYLIFTKLDETRYFGPLVNLPVMKNIPLLLVTTGQNVPDDMEIPDGRKIAKKVVQEIPSLWSIK